MNRRLFTGALACLLISSCESNREERIQAERDKLLGTWRATQIRLFSERRFLDQDEVDSFKVVIGGGVIRIEGKLLRKNETVERSYWCQTDPSREPKRIDLHDKTVTPGIYKVEEDQLTIRWGRKSGRPEDFVTEPHPNDYDHYVLQRQ